MGFCRAIVFHTAKRNFSDTSGVRVRSYTWPEYAVLVSVFYLMGCLVSLARKCELGGAVVVHRTRGRTILVSAFLLPFTGARSANPVDITLPHKPIHAYHTYTAAVHENYTAHIKKTSEQCVAICKVD